MTHKTRIEKLEKIHPTDDPPVWAEILDTDRAVLRYQDGRRVEVKPEDIPQGVKVYKDCSPDDWNTK